MAATPTTFLTMKAGGNFCVVLVTAPNQTVARRLAREALGEKLVACVNLVPRVESIYWWKARIESGTEVLMICKTTRARLVAFEKFVVAHHPYETPEFIVVPIVGGTARYLSWLQASVDA